MLSETSLTDSSVCVSLFVCVNPIKLRGGVRVELERFSLIVQCVTNPRFTGILGAIEKQPPRIPSCEVWTACLVSLFGNSEPLRPGVNIFCDHHRGNAPVSQVPRACRRAAGDAGTQGAHTRTHDTRTWYRRG